MFIKLFGIMNETQNAPSVILNGVKRFPVTLNGAKRFPVILNGAQRSEESRSFMMARCFASLSMTGED